MRFQPHKYQETAIDMILKHTAAGLFLDMGLGKTVSTLTAIDKLMYDSYEVNKVLVIAPLRVARDTWSSECDKWDHLKHLRISKILGDKQDRLDGIAADADIYIINRENVHWLVEECRKEWKWDMLVIDELSSFKSSKSQRFRALKKVRPMIKRIVGLTGTPVPNGLIDLWPQMYLLDLGERLGRTITSYRDRYFVPGRRNGAIVYEYKPKPEACDAIKSRISDICLSMTSADYLTLPDRIDNFIEVNMSEVEMKAYKELEKEQVLSLGEAEIVAFNAASVSGKLLQLANGAIYNDDGGYEMLHNRKIEALEEIIDSTDEPVLVFYNFKHDYERLKSSLEKYKPRKLETSADIQEWNEGKIKILLAHPASVGHGLNIQAGGHIIVWFGLNWSLELYQQANARLYRQGQTRNVIIHHLITKGTIDEDVIKALRRKDAGQAALLEALKERMMRYGGK